MPDIPPRRRPRPRAALAFAVTALLAILWTHAGSADRAEAQEAASFRVIAHGDVAESGLEAKDLSKIFLKKIKRWDDDTPIVVFDLVAESEIRDTFSRTVHRKSISAIKSYWQRMIFSGRDVAPDELDGEAAMLERIAGTPGAVGYVSASGELPAGVKVLEILEN